MLAGWVQAQRKGQQSEASTPSSSPGGTLPGFAPASADMITLLVLPADVQPASPPPGSAAPPERPSSDGHNMPVLQSREDKPTPMDTSQNDQPSGIRKVSAGADKDSNPPPASEIEIGKKTAGHSHVHGLDTPYLRVDKGLSVSKLQQFVAAKLQEQQAGCRQHGAVTSSPCNGVAVGSKQLRAMRLYCNADRLPEESTLGALYGRQLGNQIVLLHYRLVA